MESFSKAKLGRCDFIFFIQTVRRLAMDAELYFLSLFPTGLHKRTRNGFIGKQSVMLSELFEFMVRTVIYYHHNRQAACAKRLSNVNKGKIFICF